jgi:hypothetical protein
MKIREESEEENTECFAQYLRETLCTSSEEESTTTG